MPTDLALGPERRQQQQQQQRPRRQPSRRSPRPQAVNLFDRSGGLRLARALSLVLILAVTHCMPHDPETPEPRPTDAPRLLEGLGGGHHPITTTSPLAQRYFDQGLALSFGFNHESAIDSFEAARRIDPACGMCAWGIALALGPNINRPMGPDAARRAYIESRAALDLTAARGTPREQHYARALAVRYADPAPEDRGPLDLAYADAMRELARSDPEDDDAATLFAESLMDLAPWAYWGEGGQPRDFTLEMVETLERVLARDPEHLGANHYYIHAVEEYFPEKAEPAADRLGSLAPEAGHLVHMPSHIYWRVGRYADAAEINQRASEADERFFAWCRGGAFYQAAYYPHNVHFLWAASAAEGRRELALMTARKLESITRPGLEEVPILQEFVATPMLTMARFGLWDSILGEARPAQDQVYLVGVWHYTRALAQVAIGRIDEAQADLDALDRVIADPRADALALASGTSTARGLLEIARAHLQASFAQARGQLTSAVASLEQAAALHDALPYMEPPPWYAPPRQALGAVLLDLGRAEEAEAVYRKDLEQYPKNGWSLFGLTQSLRAQGDTARAEWAQRGFEQAWQRADVPLERSHF